MSDINTKLQALKSKQVEWSQKVTPEEKLLYLEFALGAFLKDFSLEGMQTLGKATAKMKGVSGKEAEYVVSEEIMMMTVTVTGYLSTMIDAYKFRLGKSDNQDVLSKIPTRKVGNHVVGDVFPLTPIDQGGPMAVNKGELWFQPSQVQDASQVQPFDFEALDEKMEGVMVILGAGNYTLLTVMDLIYALFVKNSVTFVKQHPLRDFLEPMLRTMFKPLYEKGYLESEPDQGLERSSQIVYSPHVSKVHMTGGKATHDAIVWGAVGDEQAKNKANNTPKLKQATMTSELGCVTPYFVTPTAYSQEELAHQAQVLISAKWCNGSASCNAPQVAFASKHWDQLDDFVNQLEKSWAMSQSTCTYYPGAKKRWTAFQKAYPDAKVIRAKPGSEGESEDDHLPLLLVQVDVNLSTDSGRQKAKEEYAFRNEAFAPVLIVAKVHNEADPRAETFMKQAVDFANTSLFGSLSCSVIVPSSAEGLPMVEKAIEDLRYGAIAINVWPGSSYLTFPLAWGAFPGDSLENVESGIGNVVNGLVLPNIEKSVLRTPCVDENVHFVFTKSFDDIIAANMGLTHFVLGAYGVTA